MQRVLDIAKLCFYVLGTLAMLRVGYSITSTLSRMNREMDRRAIAHEEMFKRHLIEFQEHERRMQQR